MSPFQNIPQQPIPVVNNLIECVEIVEEANYERLIGREGRTINKVREVSGASIIIKEILLGIYIPNCKSFQTFLSCKYFTSH